MTKSKNTNAPGNLDEFIRQLKPDLGELVQAIRETIISAHGSIGEHIKWNSPAFYYTGKMAAFKATEYKRDLLVIHTRNGFALLVFPTGAAIQPANAILEGTYTDGRRMITIKSRQELEQKKEALIEIIRQWIKLTEV